MKSGLSFYLLSILFLHSSFTGKPVPADDHKTLEIGAAAPRLQLTGY